VAQPVKHWAEAEAVSPGISCRWPRQRRCLRRLPPSTSTKLQVAEAEAVSPVVAAERDNEAAGGRAHWHSSSQTASRANRADHGWQRS
jgi:hypothetical protein